MRFPLRTFLALLMSCFAWAQGTQPARDSNPFAKAAFRSVADDEGPTWANGPESLAWSADRRIFAVQCPTEEADRVAIWGYPELHPLGVLSLPLPWPRRSRLQEVALSRRGELLACLDQGWVGVWELASGRLLWKAAVQGGSLAFSPTEDRLAATVMGGGVKVWNARTGRKEFTLTGPTEPRWGSLAFSPDGASLLATCTVTPWLDRIIDRVVRGAGRAYRCELWRWSLRGWSHSGHWFARGENYPGFRWAALSPDGKRAVSIDAQLEVIRLEGMTSERRLAGISAPYYLDGAFAPDGRSLALLAPGPYTDPDQRLVRILNHEGQILREFPLGDRAGRLTFGPTGRELLTWGGGSLSAWDPGSGALIHRVAGHGARITSLETMGPDGLLSGSLDGRVIQWDRKNLRPTKISLGATNVASASRDGNLVVTAGWQERTPFTPTKAPAALRNGNLEPRPVPVRTLSAISASLDPKGTWVAWGREGGRIDVESPEGKPLAHFSGHEGRVETLRASPDGRSLLSGGADGQVIQWSMPRGTKIRRFLGLNAPVLSLAISKDGTQLAAGARDGQATVWNLQDGRVRGHFPHGAAPVLALAFSPEGHLLATGTGPDGSREGKGSPGLRLWRPDTAQLAGWLKQPPSGVSALAFDPNGLDLYSGDVLGSIRRHPIQTLRDSVSLAPPIRGPSPGVISAVSHARGMDLEPGGKRILTWGGTTLKEWSLPGLEPIQTLQLPRSPGSASRENNVYYARYLRGGTQILSKSGDDILRIWDASTGRVLKTWKNTYDPNNLRLAVASENGRWLVFVGSKESHAFVYDLEAKRQVARLGPFQEEIWATAISSNRIAFNTWGAVTTYLFEVGTWSPVATIPLKRRFNSATVGALSFRKDGRLLLSQGGGGYGTVLNASNGKSGPLLLYFPIPTEDEPAPEGPSEERTTLNLGGALSPDGRWLAAGCQRNDSEGRIVLLDLKAPSPTHRMELENSVQSMAFTPDGQHLVALLEYSEAGDLRVWALKDLIRAWKSETPKAPKP